MIVIIRLGYGSSTSKKRISYKGLSDDVIELLDHLRLKKVSVIGYSLGGLTDPYLLPDILSELTI
ncbi:alpha/beta fold hydrolase [Paraglaciecola psychrophila]|uniref:alpha/beta fold hydrolase n=1 Tax=Paraglaciecola psychrophila TaxID=326544 RepID=UPI000557B406